MLGFAIKGFVGLCLIASGWVAGSIYPAPTQWLGVIRDRVDPLLTQLDLSPDGLARLRASLSSEDFARLTHAAAILAESTGDVIRIDRDAAADLDEHAEAVAAEQGRVTRLPAGRSVFEDTLHLCPGMAVSNAPPADDERRVEDYAKFVNVNSVTVAVNPTHGACLSSGVGMRSGRRHKGLDFYSRDGGPIFAAADGTVIEMLYRNDYGNMLLIDHGRGAYTRYAHLSSFAPDVAVGSVLAAGQQIGLMGNTASYQIPVHLHYELLVGNYDNPAASFGLTASSPFDFPAATPASSAEQTQIAANAGAGAPAHAQIVPLQLTRDEPSGGLCPGGPISEATVIRIRRGDTLFAIALACYGDPEAWRQVVNCNRFFGERNRGGVSPLNTGHLLYVGDRVVLPAPGGECPS
jgi:murein DD-endopeptidase MepM/ murein hydrolase activator NlpD